MEFGIYTFGDLARDASNGARVRERIDGIVEAAKFADEVGIDVFGVSFAQAGDDCGRACLSP